MATKKKKDLWADDKLQFARLLWEMEGVGALTPKVLKGLQESMDLDKDGIFEILERARIVFEKSVASLPSPNFKKLVTR